MAKKATAKKLEQAPVAALKIDLGCGKNKKEGFTGVDSRAFPGVDVVCDLGMHRWPWKDGTVEEAHCSHMVEHLEWKERVHFFNELYRVLKKGSKATVIMPHWCSSRYYGDPTHKSPFSEFAWFYMNKEWRKVNAPHADAEDAPGPLAYACDFDVSYGYSLHPELQMRSQEFNGFALKFYKEAAQDMIATLVKK